MKNIIDYFNPLPQLNLSEAYHARKHGYKRFFFSFREKSLKEIRQKNKKILRNKFLKINNNTTYSHRDIVWIAGN